MRDDSRAWERLLCPAPGLANLANTRTDLGRIRGQHAHRPLVLPGRDVVLDGADRIVACRGHVADAATAVGFWLSLGDLEDTGLGEARFPCLFNTKAAGLHGADAMNAAPASSYLRCGRLKPIVYCQNAVFPVQLGAHPQKLLNRPSGGRHIGGPILSFALVKIVAIVVARLGTIQTKFLDVVFGGLARIVTLGSVFAFERDK